jgi:hypothetical protein
LNHAACRLQTEEPGREGTQLANVGAEGPTKLEVLESAFAFGAWPAPVPKWTRHAWLLIFYNGLKIQTFQGISPPLECRRAA